MKRGFISAVRKGVVMKKPLVVTILLALMLGLLSVASGCASFEPTIINGASLTRFQSAEEFVAAFQNDQWRYGYMDGSVTPSSSSFATASGGSSKELSHSTTNVQVEGVDEADIVKTDGEFIYVTSGNSLFIIAAYPPKDMKIVSRIEFDNRLRLSGMFVYKNRLVVIGQGYPDYNGDPQERSEYFTQQSAFVKIYDISDRSNPGLLKTIEYEGYYNTSRMIDDNVYVVLTGYPRYLTDEKENPQPSDIIPRYRTAAGQEEPGALKPICDWSEVECTDPKGCSSFLSILSLSLKDNGNTLEKRVIAGNSENVYASSENIYVATTDYEYYSNPEIYDTGNTTHTTVFKFKFEGASVSYLASADVPGTVLNQFSMDESKGYFRIATTIGHVTREGSGSTNNVYILDPALNITGRLEGLAQGETIYSARFVGDRAYLVTFKKVDPFFVLDLSDPANPKVLGALKIPGYSDYLHPYDETHIIGVGKNTVEADPGQGNFAWYQGMKIALFDVSDFSNPKEMCKVEIGDRGTDSYALDDHKAFLFDRERSLLVLPILLAELTPEEKSSPDTRANEYGEFTYQGAYVYDISLTGGIELRGRITHSDNPQEFENSRCYYHSDSFVERSLYIENSLYTISQTGVKANDLDTLEEQAYVNLSQ